MREVQRAALAAFLADGYDVVTVDRIAAAVGSSPSTVYRHFGTKEAIVLWDEHEEAVGEELQARLVSMAPLPALRDTFVRSLGERYQADSGFERQRVRFAYETPQVHAAALLDDVRVCAEIVAAIVAVQAPADPSSCGARRPSTSAELVAGVALVTLDVALQRWAFGDGRLPELIGDAFDELAALNDGASGPVREDADRSGA